MLYYYIYIHSRVIYKFTETLDHSSVTTTSNLVSESAVLGGANSPAGAPREATELSSFFSYFFFLFFFLIFLLIFSISQWPRL
jgi:hypothetical protein